MSLIKDKYRQRDDLPLVTANLVLELWQSSTRERLPGEADEIYLGDPKHTKPETN